MAVGSKSVHEAILAVTENIGRLQKGVDVAGVGDGRDYRVVGIDQIIERVQPVLVAEQLSIVPRVTESSSWDTDGRHWAKVTVEYVLTGPDGSEIVACMVGESENNNDKSLSAALSMAEKYFYKQTFKIVTGDPDPDTQGTKVVGVPAAAPVLPPGMNNQSQKPQLVATPPGVAPPPPQAFSPQPAQQSFAAKVETSAGPTSAYGTKMSSVAQQQTIWAITHKILNWDDPKMYDYVEHTCGQRVTKSDQLTSDDASKVIKALKVLEKQAKGQQ